MRRVSRRVPHELTGPIQVCEHTHTGNTISHCSTTTGVWGIALSTVRKQPLSEQCVASSHIHTYTHTGRTRGSQRGNAPLFSQRWPSAHSTRKISTLGQYPFAHHVLMQAAGHDPLPELPAEGGRTLANECVPSRHPRGIQSPLRHAALRAQDGMRGLTHT
jgi:hypothetical protein